MLNTTHFVLLAGDPSSWDEETRNRCRPSETVAGCFNSEDLCAVQVDQFRRGRRSAELCRTVYGWTVRSATNLDNRQIIARAPTFDEALTAGIEWANADPKNREFFAASRDLPSDMEIPAQP